MTIKNISQLVPIMERKLLAHSSFCKHDGYNGDMDKQEMA
jgi:hypothetical protein